MAPKTLSAEEFLFSGVIDSWETANGELEKILEFGCLENDVWSIYMTRQLVGRINNIRLVIYPNDHPPPHIHVFSPGHEINAKFQIADGFLMEGSNISSSHAKKVRGWLLKRQDQLQHIWETTRPC